MSENTRKVVLVVVVLLVLGSIFLLNSQKSDRSDSAGDTALSVSGMTAEEKAKMYEVGQEISTPDAFINVDEVTVAGEFEKGNIVLIDFWTYSCINCQRTLPFLNNWHEKYGDQGLTIIGVHTPEFGFEEELENVQRAVDQFNVAYPVVLDNDYSTWRSYNNRHWPHKFLIDIDGFIVYDHIGEGSYDVTEAKIVELLEERAERLEEETEIVITGGPEDVDEVDFSRVNTPEIYFGHSRLAYIQNLPNTSCFDSVCEFVIPMNLAMNMFSLDGQWRIEEESAVLVSEDGGISLRFSASNVNFVAEGTGEPVTMDIFLDGEQTGSVTVNEAGLYNLFDAEGEYGEHELELKVKGSGLSVFTFTFG